MPNPDCVLRASILNSLVSQFCQSTTEIRDISVDSSLGAEERSGRQDCLEDLLGQASDLIEEVELWNASIPPHWQSQYQFQSIHSAQSNTDPWTITFLAITHSTQTVFYLHVLACCREMQIFDPQYNLPKFPGGLVEFCEDISDQIKHLLGLICYTVSATIGYLDANNEFQPIPTPRLANSNTLIWPMWAVVTCPLASCLQIQHCRRALHYIGQLMGHKLAYSLLYEDPSRHTGFPPARGI